MGESDPFVDCRTEPARYRHVRLAVDGEVATLLLAVDPAGGLFPGTELKLNSYDLGVDIEIADAVQRLRFEHPQVRTVVLRSGKDNVFCAGANIRMLGKASHGHKVNFCKFTNETRNSIEDASAHSGQTYLCAINGTASGGGYELALACAHIMLVDDGSSAVSLPQLPLLAVLPGTGGLTRLVDKRRARHDHADVLCTTSEGIRGQRAVDWRLVDELVPRSRFETVVQERAAAFVAVHGERVLQSGTGVRHPPGAAGVWARGTHEQRLLRGGFDHRRRGPAGALVAASRGCVRIRRTRRTLKRPRSARSGRMPTRRAFLGTSLSSLAAGFTQQTIMNK